MSDHVDSASDDRTANNAMRHQYRVLNEDEKQAMVWFKDAGGAFLESCNDFLTGDHAKDREFIIAIERMEEAVMWAVKGLTK